MQSIEGEWVILKNNEIVEHDKDIKVILNLAKNYNDKDITISKVPSSQYCFYYRTLA